MTVASGQSLITVRHCADASMARGVCQAATTLWMSKKLLQLSNHRAYICVQVWASKWTERAWLSRRARGVPDSSLFMAVLLQQVQLL